MMGTMPSGLFGLMNPKRTAMQDITDGGYSTPPFVPPQQQAEPFVWGAGGARLTPDMIAQRSRTAQGLMAGGVDTSPVGHWTQGLARVAQALVGKSQQNRLDKATQQNMSSEQQILQSLTAGGGNDQGALAAMASPYVSDGTRDALKLQWQANHKTPAQPHYWETNDGSLGMVGADGKPQVLYKDPNAKMNFIPDGLGGGQWVAVPSNVGGGDQFSAGPMAAPMPTAPVGRLTPIGGGAPSQGARTFP